MSSATVRPIRPDDYGQIENLKRPYPWLAPYTRDDWLHLYESNRARNPKVRLKREKETRELLERRGVDRAVPVKTINSASKPSLKYGNYEL